MLRVRPLEHIEVTSSYGPRIIQGMPDFHDGTDYAAAVGTPLFSMGDGVVQNAGDGVGGSGGGKAIAIIDDRDGQLFFLHLSEIAPGIVRGARVRPGQRIGATGATGRVTGPHLHLQWRPAYPDLDTADVEPVVAVLLPPSDFAGDNGEGSGAGALAALALGGLLLWGATR